MINVSELNYRNPSALLIVKRLKDESMTMKCRVIQNGLITSTDGSTMNRN